MSSAARAGMATERLARTRASSPIRRGMGAQLRVACFERKHRDAREGGAWQQGGRTNERTCLMTYAITGLSPEPFAPLFEMSDAELAARGARRVTADADRGFPCRISLEDARAGEELILLQDRKSVVEGQSVSVSGEHGWRRIIKKNRTKS